MRYLFKENKLWTFSDFHNNTIFIILMIINYCNMLLQEKFYQIGLIGKV